jgi:hypothetical protein
MYILAVGPTQSPMQWVMAPISPAEKRPDREADYSPQSSAEVKNVWRYTSTPSYVFLALYFVKHMKDWLMFQVDVFWVVM